MPRELPNDWRLKILGNEKFPVSTPKVKICQ